MINHTSTDPLEAAIDDFEENWSPESRTNIRALLQEHGLMGNPSALTELIRIDIELRYGRGIPIQLDRYFSEFDSLLSQPACVVQIAFEDFRSRAAHGHSVSVSRWRELPGVSDEPWYQQLTDLQTSPTWSHSAARTTGSGIGRVDREWPVDAKFERALETIGFRLIQEIGQGALSHVYLATQSDLADRYVVLKVVQQSLAEPQSMAMMQHTNIVPIYSFHRIHCRSVICMPYAGGVTLADFLASEEQTASRSGPSLVSTVLNRVNETVVLPTGSDGDPLHEQTAASVPAADDNAVLRPLQRLQSLGCNELALWIFQRLASALAHSHTRGVLHGDLKPANVLIRNDGEPALLDFNLARSLDHQPITHVGGTLPYMPPESYRALMGQSVAPHGSSDIYGLGVMLFEFVTGRLPFPSPRSSAAIDLEPAIRLRRESLVWKPQDSVSPSLRSVIQRCLAFDPDDRYESAEQLQEDLESERQNLRLPFAQEPLGSRCQKWIRRHPRIVSSSSVALFLLAILIPIGVSAMAWRDQSRYLAASAKIKAFSDESDAVLSTMMANPLRHHEAGILSAMRPLEKFRVLDSSAQLDFHSPLMTQGERAEHRVTALRHVLQVAFAEADWLRARNGDAVEEGLLGRLDRLVQAAIRIQGDTPSRACLYVQAERAKFTGDQDGSARLIEQAEQTNWRSDDTEIYLEAIRLITHRRYSEARLHLTSLADRGSIPSALRWTSLGRSQYHQGDYEDAKLSFTQSIEHAPKSSRLRMLRGLCYLQLNQLKRARENFTEALTLEPTLSTAWSDRGLCQESMGNYEEAIEDFTVALHHAPNNLHPLILRSRVLRTLGRTNAAQRDFDRAMQAKNLLPASLVTRALARREFDPEGALQDLEKAYALDHGNPMLLQNMATVLAKYLGRYDDAIEKLQLLSDFEPGREKAIIDRAVLLARTGQHERAKADMRKALVPPNAPVVWYQAACVIALLPGESRHNLALGFLSKALQAGYGSDALTDDTDLDALRGSEGFQSLLKTVELGYRIQTRKTRPNSTRPNSTRPNSTPPPARLAP